MHDSRGSQVTVRRYEPGDETAILDLFSRSFHLPRSIEHWRWKFRENPWGRERIAVARTADGELAAQYAGYAVPFFSGGDSFLSHHIGDTMTAREVRHIGRGPTSVLGRTAQHFYETFCCGQVAFNYGFNVANIQKFSLRFLRSELVEPVTYRVLDLRSNRLPALSRAERWLRGCRLRLVRDVDGSWDRFFANVAPSYEFLVRRDADYVRWRYLDCPDISYVVVAMERWRRLAGWLVFRIDGSRLTIGDLLIDPAETPLVMLALRHLAGVYPIDAIDGWFPSRPRWLDEALRSFGFETRDEPQGLSLMCVPFEMPDAAKRMRESLYYTKGDSDLF